MSKAAYSVIGLAVGGCLVLVTLSLFQRPDSSDELAAVTHSLQSALTRLEERLEADLALDRERTQELWEFVQRRLANIEARIAERAAPDEPQGPINANIEEPFEDIVTAYHDLPLNFQRSFEQPFSSGDFDINFIVHPDGSCTAVGASLKKGPMSDEELKLVQLLVRLNRELGEAEYLAITELIEAGECTFHPTLQEGHDAGRSSERDLFLEKTANGWAVVEKELIAQVAPEIKDINREIKSTMKGLSALERNVLISKKRPPLWD